MHMSNKGISLLISFEGFSKTAYWDYKGYTIGYGHLGAKKGDTITKKQARELLKADLLKYENAVLKYNSIYNWSQNEFDSLVDFAYNLGTGNIKKLTADGSRSKKVIADKMLLYNKAGGKVLEGLTRRRKAERKLFLG